MVYRSHELLLYWWWTAVMMGLRIIPHARTSWPAGTCLLPTIALWFTIFSCFSASTEGPLTSEPSCTLYIMPLLGNSDASGRGTFHHSRRTTYIQNCNHTDMSWPKQPKKTATLFISCNMAWWSGTIHSPPRLSPMYTPTKVKCSYFRRLFVLQVLTPVWRHHEARCGESFQACGHTQPPCEAYTNKYKTVTKSCL